MPPENSNTQYVEIGLINPKSATNVGGVLRAAGCYQANAVRYTGQRWEYGARYNTDTKNAAKHLTVSGVTNILDNLSPSTQVVCVDLIEGATPLPIFDHPENALYIFGPEDGSISQHVINQADHVVYVPTKGCMNLAASVNVVLYDRMTKADLSHAGDHLIRESRDLNNRTKALSNAQRGR